MRHMVLTLGLALALPCAGVWAQEAQDVQTNRSVQERGTMFRGPYWAESISSPMQEFVSHNVHEILGLSKQIEAMQNANRPELVRVLQHMVRDHVLVKDAARNVLARQGKESRPVRMEMEPTPETPEQVIRHNIEHHQKMQAQTEQLLAGASTPDEQGVYQLSLRRTRQHLDWLQRMDQGQQVALGYFGETVPLGLVAGYREAIGTPGSAQPSER